MIEYRGFIIEEGSDVWGGIQVFVKDVISERTLFDNLETHAEAREAIDAYLDVQ